MKVSLEKEFEYVLEDERDLPADDQTVWILRRLTWAEKKSLPRPTTVQTPTGDIRIEFDRQTANERVLNLGLRGWRNLKDGSGGDVAFESNPGSGIPYELLALIEPAMNELGNAIVDGATIAKADSKN